jgi:HEAT repeat protein
MRHSIIHSRAILPVAFVTVVRLANAQTLADRVAGASEARVQFSYASRADVCGNGRTFIQVSGNSWYGSWNDGDRRDTCTAGPARVVLDRAGREVISVTTFVGPLPTESTSGIADLGRVRASDAAQYLLGLAERAEGRVSRDAILPAMIADSADVTARLLAIARNPNSARETRRSAIGWLARPIDTRERGAGDIAAALVTISKDDNDNQSVRQSALRTLARLEHGAGTASLMELARDVSRTWTAREALSALTSSGDPRARVYLRDVVRRSDLPDEVLASAVRGVGSEYSTGEDIKLLRDVYDKLPGERSREAALQAIANFGGAENVHWLMTMARDTNKPVQFRRRAVMYAYKGGAPVTEVIKLYDETTDAQLKESMLSVLVESGEKAAMDKLMLIAQKDDNFTMRRKAINTLQRSSDERVRKFLTDLADR